MNVNQTIREAFRTNLILFILKNKVITSFNKQGRTWENFSYFEYDVWDIYIPMCSLVSTFVWIFFIPPKIQVVFWGEVMRVSFPIFINKQSTSSPCEQRHMGTSLVLPAVRTEALCFLTRFVWSEQIRTKGWSWRTGIIPSSSVTCQWIPRNWCDCNISSKSKRPKKDCSEWGPA